jgi:hypothetical protein
MNQPIKLSDFTEEVLNRQLLIEGGKDTMRRFIIVNCLDETVEPVNREELQRVIDLEIKGSTYIGIIKIKRLS